MSNLHITFHCPSLACPAEFYMVMPDKNLPPFLVANNPHYQRPVKTLVMLHGYSGDYRDWLHNGGASALSLAYNLAVVMPTGGTNFWLDQPATGQKWCALVGEDLINYLRSTFGLAQTREDTLIGGNSMGGFGALHTALAYPDRFSGVAALSAAYIVDQLPAMTPDMKNPIANYEYYCRIFGDLQTAPERDCNPKVLFKRNAAEGKANPRIYLACGEQDFGIASNRAMAEFLKEQGADSTYREGPGVHDWSFWVPRADEAVKWLLGCE